MQTDNPLRLVARPEYVVLAAAVGMFAFSGPAMGQGHDRFTQREQMVLPRFCLAQKSIRKRLQVEVVPEAEREEWSRRMGPGYKHVHHYCWGLMYMKRAANQPEKREFYYGSAIKGFDYVLRNTDPTFPLYPEVLLRKGNVLRLLGQETAAGSTFQEAIRIKRDYTPAYSALIDVYLALGDRDAARQVLSNGLEILPNSKILADKKAELEGGDATNRQL